MTGTVIPIISTIIRYEYNFVNQSNKTATPDHKNISVYTDHRDKQAINSAVGNLMKFKRVSERVNIIQLEVNDTVEDMNKAIELLQERVQELNMGDLKQDEYNDPPGYSDEEIECLQKKSKSEKVVYCGDWVYSFNRPCSFPIHVCRHRKNNYQNRRGNFEIHEGPGLSGKDLQPYLRKGFHAKCAFIYPSGKLCLAPRNKCWKH